MAASAGVSEGWGESFYGPEATGRGFRPRRDSVRMRIGNGAGGPAPAAAPTQQLPAAWDREADIVVIGSGATGLPAAIVARGGRLLR